MINSIKKKIKEVNKLLIAFYGVPERPLIPPDPVDMLIATILSQNTNDKNSYQAFTKLKEKYPSWDIAAKLPRAKIESVIRVAGLAKQKSAAIKDFLVEILKERGSIKLDYLADKTDDEVLAELTRYKGVGVKTAACVLQFSMRRNVCPVDTHVHRTTNRLGIVKTNAPDRTFYILKDNMPPNIAHSFHTNLIRLGREICRPAVPACSVCPLHDACSYPYKDYEKRNVYKENKFLLLDSIK